MLKGAVANQLRNPQCHSRFLRMKGQGLVDKAICEMYDKAGEAPEGRRQRQTNVIRDALPEYFSCCIYKYMLCWLHEANITIFFQKHVFFFLKLGVRTTTCLSFVEMWHVAVLVETKTNVACLGVFLNSVCLPLSYLRYSFHLPAWLPTISSRRVRLVDGMWTRRIHTSSLLSTRTHSKI